MKLDSETTTHNEAVAQGNFTPIAGF
jgi:hypothetical protein